MMNWDDLKYFLAVARAGSVRGAAKDLDVNHATVSRRIRHFEEQLGQRLFERSGHGYEKTLIGEEIYAEAMHLEERLNSVSRKVAAKDPRLTGDIRITMPETIAEELLMDDLDEFARLHPGISLELISSARPFNLANREADVAFRITKTPPEHLIGRKVASLHRACYYSAAHADDIDKPDWEKIGRWISWTDKARRPIGKIARDYPKFKARHKMLSANMQKEACKRGMGVGILLCYMADNDPDLVRIPPYTTEHKYDLWMLYHPDLRASAKIQTFVQFIQNTLAEKRPLLEGEAYDVPNN